MTTVLNEEFEARARNWRLKYLTPTKTDCLRQEMYYLLHRAGTAHYISSPTPTEVLGYIQRVEELEQELQQTQDRITTGIHTTLNVMLNADQRQRWGLDPVVEGSHTRDNLQLITRLCDALTELETLRDVVGNTVQRWGTSDMSVEDLITAMNLLAATYEGLTK